MILSSKMYTVRLAATTTPAQIPLIPITSEVKQPDKVYVQALSTNGQVCFLKNANDVNSTGSTGGYELPAGSGVYLPIATYRDFYVVSASGTQNLQIIYLGG